MESQVRNIANCYFCASPKTYLRVAIVHYRVSHLLWYRLDPARKILDVFEITSFADVEASFSAVVAIRNRSHFK